jgi:hypothetical protein
LKDKASVSSNFNYIVPESQRSFFHPSFINPTGTTQIRRTTPVKAVDLA